MEAKLKQRPSERERERDQGVKQEGTSELELCARQTQDL